MTRGQRAVLVFAALVFLNDLYSELRPPEPYESSALKSLGDIPLFVGFFLAIDYARSGKLSNPLPLPTTAHLNPTYRMLTRALGAIFCLVVVYITAMDLWAGVVRFPRPLPTRILCYVGKLSGFIAAVLLTGGDEAENADRPA